jgi:hypothetical protein
MSLWAELEKAKAEVRRERSGTKRSKLLRRVKRLQGLMERGVVRENPTPQPRQRDVDCGLTLPRTKLHAIEQRLDHQLSDRNERKRLQRRKAKLKREIAGRDPKWFAGDGSRFEVKRKTIQILDELESKEDQCREEN